MEEEILIPLEVDQTLPIRGGHHESAKKKGVQAIIHGDILSVEFVDLEENVSVSLLDLDTNKPLLWDYWSNATHVRLQLGPELTGRLLLRVMCPHWCYSGTFSK